MAEEEYEMMHFRKMEFTSFLSSGFTTVSILNPLDRKLENSTFVHFRKKNFAKLTRTTYVGSLVLGRK